MSDSLAAHSVAKPLGIQFQLSKCQKAQKTKKESKDLLFVFFCFLALGQVMYISRIEVSMVIFRQ